MKWQDYRERKPVTQGHYHVRYYVGKHLLHGTIYFAVSEKTGEGSIYCFHSKMSTTHLLGRNGLISVDGVELAPGAKLDWLDESGEVVQEVEQSSHEHLASIVEEIMPSSAAVFFGVKRESYLYKKVLYCAKNICDKFKITK